MDSALFYPNKNSKPFKTTRGFFHPTKTNSSRWTPHILPSSCLSTHQPASGLPRTLART
ncbi:unnamed protein product [Linum tenue]|uniref:Uncharacterized protein n=1 Tax=Linum tenue TaxID=586396 RepID=A0AAV0KQL1_9ROSI|nr:unnamed protein product [Linum tenue]